MFTPKVSVAIKSCHKHAARRAAQLATWLPQLDCDFFFILGAPRPATGAPEWTSEILATDAPDTFDSIAPKVECACRYALDSNVANLFLCDDDTYAAARRLLKSGYRKHDYIGFVRPYGDVANGNVPYIQGSAMWLSEAAMTRIVLSGEMRSKIIDDGAIGRALYGKLAYTHDARYWPGPHREKVPAANNDIITTHKCDAKQMLAVHEMAKQL